MMIKELPLSKLNYCLKSSNIEGTNHYSTKVPKVFKQTNKIPTNFGYQYKIQPNVPSLPDIQTFLLPITFSIHMGLMRSLL